MVINVPIVIAVVSIIGALSVLGAIALFIYTVLKKEHEFQEKQKRTFTEYEDIIKKAHDEAKQLLEKTMSASQHLLTEAKSTNENMEKDFDKVLQTIAQRQIEALNKEAGVMNKGYQDKVSRMESTIDQNTQAMIQGAESTLQNQLTNFTQTLMAHTTKSEQMVNEKTQELLTEVQEQVELYKQEKMAKVDQAILELIQKTYKDILSKSIPPNIHKELILEALEKTKKEGLFDLWKK